MERFPHPIHGPKHPALARAPRGQTMPVVQTSPASGFTLIEVLIAMLIAVIMGGIAVYLFGQVQRGTRISLARAQLALAATTVDARLRLDAASMLGPSRVSGTAGGCLVIVPALRQGYIQLPNGTLGANKVRLRSDQLMFVSKRDPTHPHPWLSLLPQDGNASSASTAPSPTSSWEACIWYGAVRDGTLAGGDGSKTDSATWAHQWLMGRQAKLLVQGQTAADTGIWGISTDHDTTKGSITVPDGTKPPPTWGLGMKELAIGQTWNGTQYVKTGAGWSSADYVTNLAVDPSVAPSSKTDYTAQPSLATQIDLKALQQSHLANDPSGVQFTDLSNSHLRLFDNCSEIVIQWAGDLDKDGKIDTYPAGHPLAGAIIWYPEELHDRGANYNGAGKAESRLDGWNASPAAETGIAAKYRDIKANPWTGAFPAGFKPALGAWPNGRFGGGTWPARFQFDYNEADNKPNQTTASPSVPDPYVFRFDDDQYRLVRYGFRQDGSAYKNMWDGQPLPPAFGGGTLHAFPYPPLPAHPTTWVNGAVPASANPPASALYASMNAGAGVAAPSGPYPVAAAAPATDYTNFGDLMGAQMLPGDSMSGTGPNGEKYRTQGDGVAGSPNQYGSWVTVASPAGLQSLPSLPAAGDPWLVGPPPTPALTLTPPPASTPYVSTDPAIVALTAAPLWPYVTGGELQAIQQINGARLAGVAKPVGDLIPDTSPFPSAANPGGAMTPVYGPGNNQTVTYSDLASEYLRNINDPTLAGKINDWRMPQSDWPKLIRIRVRLHDSQGLVSSFSDEFLVNGRDDDGDGVVDNPEEGRMSGIWYEYILAVPYPIDPKPRTH